MSRYRHAVSGRDAHITTLRGIILLLAVGCVFLWWGWKNAPEDLTVYYPPDLRGGTSQSAWEIPPNNAYQFGWYVWQRLNRWPNNGEADYKRNIHALRPYMTPACHRSLEQEYQQRRSRGELDGRTRGMYEIPGRGYRPGESVEILSDDSWLVKLDLGVEEHYAGTPVREFYARYPLRVVRANVDADNNPWGLQIDCLEGEARRLVTDPEGQSSAEEEAE